MHSRHSHRLHIIPLTRPKVSIGRLPNDGRTQLIASSGKENAVLARLLLLKRNITNKHTQPISVG